MTIHAHPLIHSLSPLATRHPRPFITSFHIAGQYKIQELDRLMLIMHEKFGKIARVGGLVGHPDLLFIYDGDEIRKVFQREEVQPHRYRIPSSSIQRLERDRCLPFMCPPPFQPLHALPAPLQDRATKGLFRRHGRSHWRVSGTEGRKKRKGKKPLKALSRFSDSQQTLLRLSGMAFNGISSVPRCNRSCCSGR